MAGVDHIVKRNGLKQKLEELETVVRESRVIAAAQTMLQNVMRDGFAKGWQAREEQYAKDLLAKVEVNVPVVDSNIDANPVVVTQRPEGYVVDNLSLTDKVQL